MYGFRSFAIARATKEPKTTITYSTIQAGGCKHIQLSYLLPGYNIGTYFVHADCNLIIFFWYIANPSLLVSTHWETDTTVHPASNSVSPPPHLYPLLYRSTRTCNLPS